jgi:hypothetical protein
MANVYVRSAATGAGTGADWANAYTTLAAAFAAKAAGDDFWVSEDHAETQASAMTLTPPGTAASPNRVICVNHAGSVPPVSADLRTTATVTTTGAFAITLGAGYAYFRGITLSGGSGAVPAGISASGDGALVFDTCKLITPGTTGASSKMRLGTFAAAQKSKTELRNTTVQFGATADTLTVNGDFIWKNTPNAIAGATLPTTLFTTNAVSTSITGVAFLEGVDLSALASGKTLFSSTGTSKRYMVKDCKLGASVTISATITGQGGLEVDLINCDSGDTNYRTERYRYEGTQTTETTIVRTGGASDGTTPISWKIVTGNSTRYMPYECLPITIWNETVGNPVTLTVEGIWGGGAVPNNSDIWMDVEYLGTSGFPLGIFATNGPADPLDAGSALASSSETWGARLLNSRCQ